jgi:hypothetical protein
LQNGFTEEKAFVGEICFLDGKGVATIFCWGGPDFKPQTDSGVGWAHLPPPPPLLRPCVDGHKINGQLSLHTMLNFIFSSTLSEFENFLLRERILINVTTCQNETSS